MEAQVSRVHSLIDDHEKSAKQAAELDNTELAKYHSSRIETFQVHLSVIRRTAKQLLEARDKFLEEWETLAAKVATLEAMEAKAEVERCLRMTKGAVEALEGNLAGASSQSHLDHELIESEIDSLIARLEVARAQLRPHEEDPS